MTEEWIAKHQSLFQDRFSRKLKSAQKKGKSLVINDLICDHYKNSFREQFAKDLIEGTFSISEIKTDKPLTVVFHTYTYGTLSKKEIFLADKSGQPILELMVYSIATPYF